MKEIMRDRQIKKLIEKFLGPYKIKKIISENTVELELLVSMKIHLVVNVSRITMSRSLTVDFVYFYFLSFILFFFIF